MKNFKKTVDTQVNEYKDKDDVILEKSKRKKRNDRIKNSA